MIKKVAAFQQLLINSLSFRSKGSMKNLFLMWIILLILSGSSALLKPIVGNFSGLLIFPVLSPFFVYQIVNGNLKPYSFVPVSVDFIIGNLFLFAVLLTLSYLIIVFVAVYAVLGIVFSITFLMGGKESLFSAFTAGYHLGFEGFLFILFVLLIMIFTVTALSCIKKRGWRVSSIICFIVLCLTSLQALKRQFPASGDGACSFTTSAYSNQIHWIVVFTGALCLLIIPSALFLGRHFYHNRTKPFTLAERQGA